MLQICVLPERKLAVQRNTSSIAGEIVESKDVFHKIKIMKETYFSRLEDSDV